LYVIEPIPSQPEVQEPSSPAQEPSPSPPAVAGGSDSADKTDIDAADLDAKLTGMSVLLRAALGLMKEYDASPARRDRGRR
jgi:hypothetical protein